MILSYKMKAKLTNRNNIIILEMRSAERGICPISSSTMNELLLIIAGCIAHARNGHISTSGLKSDVTILFLDPDFLHDAKISAIRVHLWHIYSVSQKVAP